MQKRLKAQGVDTSAIGNLGRVVALYKERANTLNELADAIHPFCVTVHASPEVQAQHLTDVAKAALTTLRDKLAAVTDWVAPNLNAAIKETVAEHGVKMPAVAIPLRVVLLGQPQSPSIDQVLEVMGRDRVLERLQSV